MMVPIHCFSFKLFEHSLIMMPGRKLLDDFPLQSILNDLT